MAKVVNTIIEGVKGGWKALTYVSPEEKERRRVAYEKWCEQERIRMAAEAERRKAAEQFAKDVKLLYDSLIDQGFSEEEALELSKGMRIDMDKEDEE